MKKNLTVLLVILVSCLSASAKEFPITFSPDTTLKQHSSFNKVMLLDLREKKEYIGSLAAGVKKKPIVTTYPLDSMMSDFGAALIRKVATKEEQTLVIALKDLVVEEKTNGEFTIGNVYLDATFYVSKDDRYVKVLNMDSLFEFRIAAHTMEYLAKVSSRIFSGLMGSIAGTAIPSGQPVFSLQEVKNMDANTRSKYPVYNEAPKTGIYYTFEEFRNNTPGDTAFVYKHNVGGDAVSDRFYTKVEGRKKGTDLADTTCYAVYNGTKWFVPGGGGKDFKEMTRKNGDFYFTRKGQGLVLLSAGTFGYFGGGIVGYLVADAVAEGLNENNPNRQGKAVFRYKLDPETGAGIKVERLE